MTSKIIYPLQTFAIIQLPKSLSFYIKSFL